MILDLVKIGVYLFIIIELNIGKVFFFVLCFCSNLIVRCDVGKEYNIFFFYRFDLFEVI